jgi:hypothetical protein
MNLSQSHIPKSNQHSLARLSLKEIAFLVMVFGWSSWGIVLPRLLGIEKNSKRASIIASIFLLVLGICVFSFSGYSESLLLRFIALVSSVILLTAIDCSRGKFEANAVLHLVNSAYLGIGCYFVLMQNNPENFPSLWLTVLPSAPQAFDMLLLCFLFQNLGSYILWDWITPLKKAVAKWSVSTKNLINLSFIQTPQQQISLFIILSGFGLISRLWNFSLGNVYYTDGSGIPASISSFLAQFDRLYVIAWLYGYSLLLQPQFRRNKVVTRLTLFLIAVEFIYQLLSGSKGRFFNFIVLPMASVFILTKKKVSWYSVLLLGGVGLASWLVLYPTLVVYRNLLVSSALNGIDPINTLFQAYETLQSFTFDVYLETVLRPLNASGITEQVTAITSIIHYHASQESGLIWQRMFLFWVPRFLWSGKPTALSGNLIGQMSGRLSDSDITTSVLITGPGELYLYYGLLGSALMVFAGLVFRWINEATSPFKYPTPFRIAVLVAFLPLMEGLLSGSFESGLTGIIIQLAVLYLVLTLAKTVSTS